MVEIRLTAKPGLAIGWISVAAARSADRFRTLSGSGIGPKNFAENLGVDCGEADSGTRDLRRTPCPVTLVTASKTLNLKTAVRIDREPREPREGQSWNGSFLALGSFLI